MNKIKENTKADFQVAIIGTGFAGLAAAFRLLQKDRKSFVVFERASEVGGTWRDNIYPGCGCDVPSHLYSFSFELNPKWSQMYSKQPEILEYLNDCVDKHQLRKYIRFNTDIIQCEFDEEVGFWRLTDKAGNETTARIVISAIGPLNRPSIPKLKGLENFKGKYFHSSEWDYSQSLKGKKVAVIGTGASSIQFVPEIAPEVAQLSVFQRTPPWIVPKEDRSITKFEQNLFQKLPIFQKVHRGLIYWLNEFKGLAFIGNETIQKFAEKVALKHLQDSISDPQLREVFTPSYKIGCKRVLISNDYYPTFLRDNVDLVTEGIQEIGADYILDQSGKKHEVDTIIFGTGFVASEFIGVLNFSGLNQRSLIDEWSETEPKAYYGITTEGFPNLLFLVGPNTGLGHNSIVHMIESQLNYVLDYLKILDQGGEDAYLDVQAEVQENFNSTIQNRLTETVWASGCKSWYQNSEGKNTTLWPGLTVEYRQKTRKINPCDYRLIKVSDYHRQSVIS